MRKSIKVKPKKRGRPATGKDPLVGVRMPAELRQQIEGWAASQEEALSLSSAIRQLVEHGLRWSEGLRSASSSRKQRKRAASDAVATAAAEKQIDKAQAHEKPRTGRGNRKKALTEIPADLLGGKRKTAR
jgi:hypothetical protein